MTTDVLRKQLDVIREDLQRRRRRRMMSECERVHEELRAQRARAAYEAARL